MTTEGIHERLVLAAWRESGLFDERERAALAVAGAITTVPDEVYALASKALTGPRPAAVAS